MEVPRPLTSPHLHPLACHPPPICAVHPDPLDSYALATYASAANRTSELLPLEHIEKSREFVGPFAVPGTKLFEDFCKDLVHRYCLDGLVMQDKVGVAAASIVAAADGAAVAAASGIGWVRAQGLLLLGLGLGLGLGLRLLLVGAGQVFEDFCRELVYRYCLEGLVTQDKVGVQHRLLLLLLLLLRRGRVLRLVLGLGAGAGAGAGACWGSSCVCGCHMSVPGCCITVEFKCSTCCCGFGCYMLVCGPQPWQGLQGQYGGHIMILSYIRLSRHMHCRAGEHCSGSHLHKTSPAVSPQNTCQHCLTTSNLLPPTMHLCCVQVIELTPVFKISTQQSSRHLTAAPPFPYA